ncbi:MAG: ParB/RepB/Spo0J family partition protein [Alphaproteobacteria bacterium]|nr:ParB/RepB/Spo0J family partition protein [Alphaproteobacteria bacterium]
MELRHIPLELIHDTKLNMRHDRRPPDVSDILPTVKAKGILQPLLVRPYAEGGDDAVEIVAGRRRYWCGRAIVDEQGSFDPLPCAVMAPGDDASAIEASLIENAARRDADPMTEHVTFVRLIKEGRKVSEIAATFGMTDLMVEQRLALGNLLSKIQDAYRREEIDDQTVRYLTMASKQQQKDWLKLFADEDANVPLGYQVKQWLFGGQSISSKVALFALDAYTGHVVADLFGEDSYFADADLFWDLQNAAIAAKREAMLAHKWSEVIVLEPGAHFDQWTHEKTPKNKGGKVFITVSHTGEVEVHEGWLSRKEARKAEAKVNGNGTQKSAPAARPAMTQAMENYLELHRHAVARCALLNVPGTALRLLVAHALAASGNWQVKPDPQRTRNKEIAASVAQSAAQAAFAAEREAVAALLALPESGSDLAHNSDDDEQTALVFARLLTLADAEVQRIAAFAMAETLTVGSTAVEAVGTCLKADPRGGWQPDDTFFELLRDRTTVNAMLAEVAGEAVAKGNVAEKLKTQKQIIRDCLVGRNDRPKVENWLPGWMQFPFRGYGDGRCAIADAARAAADMTL